MQSDKVLLTAIDAANGAQSIFSVLSVQNKQDLFEALAQRIANPAEGLSGSQSFAVPFRQGDLLRDNTSITLGEKIFKRWNRALHEFVCKPDSDDQDVRDKILHALTGKEGGQPWWPEC